MRKARRSLKLSNFLLEYKLELFLRHHNHYDLVKDVQVVINYKLHDVIAMATLDDDLIELSPIALTDYDDLRDTIIHELCHVIAWKLDGDSGHGEPWKKYCRIYGCAPLAFTPYVRHIPKLTQKHIKAFKRLAIPAIDA